MKTFLDVLDLTPFAGRVVDVPGGIHFRCRCRRLVPADMMLDLGPGGTLPDELAALSGGDRYRCDGCWRGWVMRGRIAAARLRELTEQPAGGGAW
jgi:hypothetical protein